MPTLECDALIFDLDGVLVDSSEAIVRHWATWAESKGVELAMILQVAHGLRTEDTIRIVAPQLNAAEEAGRIEAAEAIDPEGVKPVPGAATLLAGLSAGGWAVATSGTIQVAGSRLRRAGLPSPSVLVSAGDVARGKPAPDAYLLAAQRLGAAASRCLVFEDAPVGVRGGLAAGMRVIGVATTHRPEELRGVEFIVQDPRSVSMEPIPAGSVGPHSRPEFRFRVQLQPVVPEAALRTRPAADPNG